MVSLQFEWTEWTALIDFSAHDQFCRLVVSNATNIAALPTLLLSLDASLALGSNGPLVGTLIALGSCL